MRRLFIIAALLPGIAWCAPLIPARELPVFEDDDYAEVVEEVPETPPAAPDTSSVTAPTLPQGADSPHLRPMNEADLAALNPEKPEPEPTQMEAPEGMSMLETYLRPIYAGLSKRTPTGDWVTSHFKQPLVPREQTRVAVLGYHDFSNTKTATEMRMLTAEFCRQMQFLKDSDICVISMQDFLEWRFGTRCLPARCVLITIDDGWKSVYTDAYPVLKAYGYPFTLFLYVRYIGVKGSSMTHDQIQEMMAFGATIGSHSWNHLYPSKWKRYSQTSPQYAAQLQKEFIDSQVKLSELFHNCSTYCFPGGYNTPPMLATLEASAYRAAFTVIEGKVTNTVSPYTVPRYMVFGVDSRIFRRAVNFDGQEGVDKTIAAINAAEAPARDFCPAAFEGLTVALTQQELTKAQKAEKAKAEAAKKAAEAKAAEEAEDAATPPSQPAAPLQDDSSLLW
ncbi:MAG: polysaccharide deacetylase family protein [Akkermansia sp.]|nr:polysaccharide deacetylase family protein [Akkermansia sp.]